MSVDSKLMNILEKYQSHPDFIGIELNDPNQPGAVDDAPLHIAVRREAVEEVEALIKLGAKINQPGDLGNTPLHFAAMSGRAVIVQALLKRGANVKALNEFGESPLVVAQQAGSKKVVSLSSK